MSVKIKGESIKDGSIRKESLSESVVAEFRNKKGLEGYIASITEGNNSVTLPLGIYYLAIADNIVKIIPDQTISEGSCSISSTSVGDTVIITVEGVIDYFGQSKIDIYSKNNLIKLEDLDESTRSLLNTSSDWNMNDVNNSKYIQNRTHYKEDAVTIGTFYDYNRVLSYDLDDDDSKKFYLELWDQDNNEYIKTIELDLTNISSHCYDEFITLYDDDILLIKGNSNQIYIDYHESGGEYVETGKMAIKKINYHPLSKNYLPELTQNNLISQELLGSVDRSGGLVVKFIKDYYTSLIINIGDKQIIVPAKEYSDEHVTINTVQIDDTEVFQVIVDSGHKGDRFKSVYGVRINEELIPDSIARTNQVKNKQDTLIDGVTIKTINNKSLLGSGNITISGGEGGGNSPISYGDAENSGELTGDYKYLTKTYSNTAISPQAMAIGGGANAGLKGYYYSKVSIDNKQIALSTTQPSVITNSSSPLTSDGSVNCGYQVGDLVSIQFGDTFPFCNTIASIDGNVLTMNGDLPITSDKFVTNISTVTSGAFGITNPFEFIICSVDATYDDSTYEINVRNWNVGLVDVPGSAALAEGINTYANAMGAHAEGLQTVAIGQFAHAEGYNTMAVGQHSHSEGHRTTALREDSHAEGKQNIALGEGTHVEGLENIAKGIFSHAEGIRNEIGIEGKGAHVEGQDNIVRGETAHAEGKRTTASGFASHTEGSDTKATASRAHAEGYQTTAQGSNSHAEGKETSASGENSHAEGARTRATQFASHAEGADTTASGSRSHAEGQNTTASGSNSHTEGCETKAEGVTAHAEGWGTIASGESSHAEGYATKATNYQAHAEGDHAEANGDQSHAEGWYSIANGDSSHAEGIHTITSNEGEHAEGKYNKSNSSTIHSVGIGESDTDRRNAHEITDSGAHYIYGIGDYDGTNACEANAQGKIAKDLKTVLNDILNNSGGGGGSTGISHFQIYQSNGGTLYKTEDQYNLYTALRNDPGDFSEYLEGPLVTGWYDWDDYGINPLWISKLIYYRNYNFSEDPGINILDPDQDDFEKYFSNISFNDAYITVGSSKEGYVNIYLDGRIYIQV